MPPPGTASKMIGLVTPVTTMPPPEVPGTTLSSKALM
jgi:hypothetical protein